MLGDGRGGGGNDDDDDDEVNDEVQLSISRISQVVV